MKRLLQNFVQDCINSNTSNKLELICCMTAVWSAAIYPVTLFFVSFLSTSLTEYLVAYIVYG